MKVHLISLILRLSSFAICIYSLTVRSEVILQPRSPIREIRPSQSDDTRTFFSTYSYSQVKFKNSKRNVVSTPSAPRLSKRANDFWTNDEDSLLQDLKSQDWPWKDIANALPGRTEGSAQQRYHLLQNKPLAPKKVQIPWTPGQVKLLQHLKANGKSWKEITKAFPGRSQGAVESRYIRITKNASKSNKSQKQWTSEEDERLLELAEDGLSWEGIAKQLSGRSLDAIARRYKQLGGDKQAKEDAMLIQAIGEGKTWEEISQALGKSEVKVKGRASMLRKLGRITLTSLKQIHPYTDAELELLITLREDNVSWADISKRFPERSKSALQQRYWKYKSRKEEEEKAQKKEGEDP